MQPRAGRKPTFQLNPSEQMPVEQSWSINDSRLADIRSIDYIEARLNELYRDSAEQLVSLHFANVAEH